jgi:hypothetical protein
MPRYARAPRHVQTPNVNLDKHKKPPSSYYSNATLAALFLLCVIIAFASDSYKHRPNLLNELKQGNLAVLWQRNETADVRADPLRRPVEEYASQIHTYFEAENFAVLERLVTQLRISKQRLAGGEWKLAAFYQGLRPSPQEKDTAAKWQVNLNRLGKWARQYPNSATPMIAMVDNFAQFAEPIKTREDFSRLPAGRRQQLNEGIEVGKEALEAAATTSTKDPHLYAAMLELGKVANWDKTKFDQIYESGVQIEPLYQQLHQAKAAYLLPTWHGRLGESEEFTQSLSDRVGGAAGQQLYYFVAANLTRRIPDNANDQIRFSLSGIKEGFKSLENSYGIDTKALNDQSRLLTRSGDLNGAHEIFNRIGSNFDTTAWRSKTEFENLRASASQAGDNTNGPLGKFNFLLLGAYGASLLLARSFLGSLAGPVTNLLTVGTITGMTADLNQQEQLTQLINYTREQIETLAAILDRASR